LLLVLLLLYAYIFYPLWLRKKAKGKTPDYPFYLPQDDLPFVTILIPLQNEEKVIEQKLESILQGSYPREKLSVCIGLDACTDSTKAIIERKFSMPAVTVSEFSMRCGKPNVINQLMETVPFDASIVMLTDANVIFSKNTIYELVKYFKDECIGLVDSNIRPGKIENENESDYWNYETAVKQDESVAFGMIPGPSGGCYAIRRKLFTPVPQNFLVDDFFIGFNIVLKSFKTILNKEAICYEDISTDWQEEFVRKIRIATGNFQNLWHFRRHALRWNKTSLIFLSHKVLRWETPFILLILYCMLLVKCTLLILSVTLFLPFVDLILFTFDVEFRPLRRFHYFIAMNIAVFLGFLKFCKGVKSNVWQPTTRK
jgi:cellulose synthase/poly-beta-1,6-N-acetylglucosamine synthase-like glycosyltransferase